MHGIHPRAPGRQDDSQILVTCDDQPSHTFDISILFPGEQGPPQPLDDSIAYGKAVYQALFPPVSAARRELEAMPERILLVTTDETIGGVAWEYAYGLYGAEDTENFLVLACHFVRGLPDGQRIAPPTLDSGLHIVAVPSDPLSIKADALNIDGEWLRLQEIIQGIPYAITLEHTRPPTIEKLRYQLANQHNRVMHFIDHGGQDATGAFLCFEREDGDLEPVTAREFVIRVRRTVFLVTVNACASAAPGPGFLVISRLPWHGRKCPMPWVCV